ncbi:MAG: AarF/UbiB family protein [Abditibacteriaceae bacterium]
MLQKNDLSRAPILIRILTLMSLLTLPATVADIKRLRTIITQISEAGFAYAVSRTRLTHLVSWPCRVRCFFRLCVKHANHTDPVTAPVRLRLLLIRLGPTFIKLGQMLSVRSDLLPQEYTAELSQLTSNVPPVPFEQARDIIERELGKPLHTAFPQFDKTPIGAASLAQVYRATLPSGERVAVKVQRPGIRLLVEHDIDLLRYLARWIERHAPEVAGYRPVALVEEFADAIGRELDFTTEASHAKRFAMMFADSDTVRIARVYDAYSSSRVLTMDLIDGAAVDDTKKMAQLGIEPAVFARNGAEAILRQVFIEGFFHADPHPGNYFALPGNVFAFIDYGMAGRLSNRERWELAAFFMGFMRRDAETAVRHLKRLMVMNRDANLPVFEHDVDDILYGWMGADFQQIQLGRAFVRVLESGRKNGVSFPSSLALLGKALFTTEAMGRNLDPHFDLTGLLQSLAGEIVKARLNPMRLKDAAQDRMFDTLTYAQELPEEALRLLALLREGELTVRLDDSQLHDFESSFATQGMKRLGAIFAVVLLFAAVAAYGVENNLFPVHLTLTGAGLLLFVVGAFFLLGRSR